MSGFFRKLFGSGPTSAEECLQRGCECQRRGKIDKAIVVDYHGTGEVWSPNDTIPGVYEKGLPEVMADVGNATGSVTTIASQVDSLAAAMVRNGGLLATVDNFMRTSRELAQAVAENREALRTTMANFAETSDAAKDLVVGRKQELAASLDHFAAAAEKLDRLSGQLDSLRVPLQSAISKLDRGDGTLGKLVNEDRLYTDLASSVHDLRAMIQDIKANPRKYFKFSVF